MMKWVAAAILAGAGIWAGATWAIILSGTEWRWIAVAIAVESGHRGGAIVIPRLRPTMLLGAGVALFMTAAGSCSNCHESGASHITGAAGLHPVAGISAVGPIRVVGVGLRSNR